MGFTGIMPLAEAANWQSFFFKTSVPFGTASRWYDAAVGAGTPVYQAYVGSQYESTPITGQSNQGIYLGPTPSAGQTKHLFALSAGTSTASVPLTLLLADYLMFYPLIDMDSLDPQDMTNSLSLTRYTSGEGVQAYFVVAAPMVSNGTVTVTYTNSEGTSNRTTTFGITFSGTIGTIVNNSNSTLVAGASAPFIPLANGDRGIRSIQTVTCNASMGGFCNIVLVKPLATHLIREQNTEAETVFFTSKANCVQIQPGAYLNFIALNNTATTFAPLRGFVQFTWN
jgi:hypothetical protein